jgi:crotonobetainyl-CoA:carnitine CoA-transferase CaiB-like acyl-CoA transferase
MDIGVSAMMMGSEMGYAGLARLIGRPESTGDQIVVSNMQVATRRQAAAAMSTAMMKGDVEGVLAALRLLGVPATVH